MSMTNQKVFIASKYTNHISYRALTAFERRNQKMFELSHSAHDTWEKAHACLLEQRAQEVEKARKVLASAERSMAKAKTMTAPHKQGEQP